MERPRTIRVREEEPDVETQSLRTGTALPAGAVGFGPSSVAAVLDGLLTGLGPRSMAPHTWWWHPFRCGSGVTTTSTTAAPTKEVP